MKSQYVAFCEWLLSLHIMLSRCIRAVAHVSSAYPSLVEQYASVWAYHIWFIHSWADGHLGCFHFLATVNNAAANIHVQAFVQMYVFISPGHIPRSGTAGSYGDSMFNCLRNCQTVFQSSCTIYNPAGKIWGFQFPDILVNICYYLVLLLIAVLVGVNEYLIVATAFIFKSIFTCIFSFDLQNICHHSLPTVKEVNSKTDSLTCSR